MPLMATSIPTVSAEFYKEIDAAFPPITPQPNVSTMDEIMHNAGAREVIEWIKAKAVHSSVITGADVTRTINVREL